MQKWAKRLAWWAAIAFVAFYLINQPTGAAGLLSNLKDGALYAANSLSIFVNALE